ncbi:MAG: hypothetical protein ABWY06_06000 [Pseudomonas sp.]|uniref:hypothetical protein n=1 Tax=Pseudomonas sp. TaxID=306 RepID=UPI00339262E9
MGANREGQLTTRREANGTAQNHVYYRGAELASVGSVIPAKISDTFDPISADTPGRTPTSYVVQAGDTLESVA